MKKLTIITAIMLTVNLLSAQWIKQDLNYPYEGYFMDIFFIDQDHGWVVGHSQNEDLCFETIDGGITWSQIDGVTGNFNSVLFLDDFNGWIVGTQGIIWHWDNHEGIGLGWIKHKHLSDWHHFTGLSFTDTINGKISFITGGFNNGGVCETMDGGWNCNITFFTGKMYDVFFFDELQGWLVGSYGQVWNTNDGGQIWEDQGTNYDHFLYSICMIDQLTGWIVGGDTYTNNGIILHTINGGETWNVQALDTIPHLRSCTFLDEYNGWAVGDYGTILHTSNGGQTWENQESGVLAHLLGVFFIDQNNGWICGDSAIVLHTDNGGIVGINENYISQSKSNIYPNPSKGLATITYELNQKELITMSILNIRGQEVKQISLGKVEKGKFELDFSKFPPGIYFIHLQTEKEILTEKLIIE